MTHSARHRDPKLRRQPTAQKPAGSRAAADRNCPGGSAFPGYRFLVAKKIAAHNLLIGWYASRSKSMPPRIPQNSNLRRSAYERRIGVQVGLAAAFAELVLSERPKP